MSSSLQATAEPLDSVAESIQSAKAAGLRYVYDSKPGITRKRTATGFRYISPDATPLRDPDALGRIKSLAIPPAWIDVWICPLSNGHLQASGRDAKGRKQSRYHPRWRETRDEAKYERMLLFGEALPHIREQVEHDMALAGMPRRKILAALVRLLETTFIRVGNVEYARENQSYGLTTMRNKHVDIDGSTVNFHFKGKSGVLHNIDVNDRRLARIVKRCREIPGYELFQYIDDEGQHHSLDSADVNDYLSEITGQHFTAKDFRTWAGSVLASMSLREFDAYTSETQAKKNIVQAIQSVAARLGNTPSVCRKCYVHPAVLDSYLSGTMLAAVQEITKDQTVPDSTTHATELRPEEAELMRLLRQRLEVASPSEKASTPPA